MNDDQLHAMQGRVEALSLALSSLMANLQPLHAAQVALGLKTALEMEKSTDVEQNTPASAASARDTVAESYCALLSAVAQNG